MYRRIFCADGGSAVDRNHRVALQIGAEGGTENHTRCGYNPAAAQWTDDAVVPTLGRAHK